MDNLRNELLHLARNKVYSNQWNDVEEMEEYIASSSKWEVVGYYTYHNYFLNVSITFFSLEDSEENPRLFKLVPPSKEEEYFEF